MTVSLAEATAAARRIQASLSPGGPSIQFDRDADTLATFVLRTKLDELLRELEVERDLWRRKPYHGPEPAAFNRGQAAGIGWAIEALTALAEESP